MIDPGRTNNQGFTLLEVLLAITLTALVLGNLFALQSQSKRLSFKAQSQLSKTINARAYLNASWIGDQALNSYLDKLSQLDLSIKNKKQLTKPVDKISPNKYYLQSFDIVNDKNEVLLSTVRMQRSMLNRQ